MECELWNLDFFFLFCYKWHCVTFKTQWHHSKCLTKCQKMHTFQEVLTLSYKVLTLAFHFEMNTCSWMQHKSLLNWIQNLPLLPRMYTSTHLQRKQNIWCNFVVMNTYISIRSCAVDGIPAKYYDPCQAVTKTKFCHHVGEVCWSQPIRLLKLGHVTSQWFPVRNLNGWPKKKITTKV